MAQQRSKLGPTHKFTFISKTQSCKRYFFEVFKYKYKILLRNVFEILLSNTSTLRPKIQYTKYLFAIVFEIQNMQVRSYNTNAVEFCTNAVEFCYNCLLLPAITLDPPLWQGTLMQYKKVPWQHLPVKINGHLLWIVHTVNCGIKSCVSARSSSVAVSFHACQQCILR